MADNTPPPDDPSAPSRTPVPDTSAQAPATAPAGIGKGAPADTLSRLLLLAGHAEWAGDYTAAEEYLARAASEPAGAAPTDIAVAAPAAQLAAGMDQAAAPAVRTPDVEARGEVLRDPPPTVIENSATRRDADPNESREWTAEEFLRLVAAKRHTAAYLALEALRAPAPRARRRGPPRPAADQAQRGDAGGGIGRLVGGTLHAVLQRVDRREVETRAFLIDPDRWPELRARAAGLAAQADRGSGAVDEPDDATVAVDTGDDRSAVALDVHDDGVLHMIDICSPGLVMVRTVWTRDTAFDGAVVRDSVERTLQQLASPAE